MKNNIINIGISIDTSTHLLIAGETGSGKSVCMNAIITELYKDPAAKLYLIDLKYIEFSHYKKIGLPVYTDIQTAAGIISRLHGEMIESYKRMSLEENSPKDSKVYIIIDEYAELSTHENKFLKNRIIQHINSIARLGRAAGYHLIISTQYPTKNIISMQLKMNCQKICLRCNSDIGYRVMLDKSGCKLHGKGDAIYLDNTGNITRFQVMPATEKYVSDFIKTVLKYM